MSETTDPVLRTDSLSKSASEKREHWEGFLPPDAILMRSSSPQTSRAPAVRDFQSLDEMKAELSTCQRCALGTTRTHLVFADGNPQAPLVFLGEAPGQQEDETGVPFVGRAGQLLTKMIEAMGLDRSKDVYICNVVKCRPPENRYPEDAEVAACSPFLTQQLGMVKPKLIITLGKCATYRMLGGNEKTLPTISKLRGEFTQWNGVPVLPTFHPSYLLRNPAAKRETWGDLQKAMEFLKSRASV